MNPVVRVTLLGSAQDGGFPQVGCFKTCCMRVRDKTHLASYPVALGIIGSDGSPHLIEASREMGRQFEIWKDLGSRPISSLCLTHAHLGHIDGLGLFGREVMNSQGMVVHCSQSLAKLIEKNPVWKIMLEQGAIQLNVWSANSSFEPSPNCGFRVVPVPVAHRAELSDNHALLIQGTTQNLLFMPDLDRWDEVIGGTRLREWLLAMNIDIALIDGTFWSRDEIIDRDLSEIPHPFVEDTLALLGEKVPNDPDIRFIHLNHTNPLHDPESTERAKVKSHGWGIGIMGECFTL